MQEAGDGGDTRKDGQDAKPDENSRPQQAGEGGTTRFGMEDGDNTDIPVPGGPSSDEYPDASE